MFQESLGYVHQLTSEGNIEDSTWLLRSCASVLLTIVKLEGENDFYVHCTVNKVNLGFFQKFIIPSFCSHKIPYKLDVLIQFFMFTYENYP
jgi:hypothetical protein